MIPSDQRGLIVFELLNVTRVVIGSLVQFASILWWATVKYKATMILKIFCKSKKTYR